MSKKFKAHFLLNEMLLTFKQTKQNEDQKLNQNWMKNCWFDIKENRKIGVGQVKLDRCRSNTNTFCCAFSDDKSANRRQNQHLFFSFLFNFVTLCDLQCD